MRPAFWRDLKLDLQIEVIFEEYSHSYMMKKS